MKYLQPLIVLLAAVFIVSCSDDDSSTQTGTYRYTAFLEGSPVVEGFLQLDVLTTTQVSGSWEFARIGSSTIQVGPQVGTGTLEGSFDGAVLSMNLNPGVADNNVFLSGTFQGDTIRGEWSFSGFPGVISQGTFIAEHE
jgi:hypothetical protein